MRLAEFQAQARGAILDGDALRLRSVLTGGRDPLTRFAIHQRHYEASLVRALIEKFPATVWLAGSSFVTEAARAFVQRHPPHAPCIAEYGADFPAYLAGRADAERADWLRSTGELEWRLGRVALAVDHAPIGIDALRSIEAARLADCTVVLQPGLSYLAADWPVDDLVKLFLSETAPDSYTLTAERVFLEVRGARGTFSMARLSAGAFAFRQPLAQGSTIGNAAEAALDADRGFDAGTALLQLIADGLVTTVHAVDTLMRMERQS